MTQKTFPQSREDFSSRTDELVEKFINGQFIFVYQELLSLPPEKMILMTSLIMLELEFLSEKENNYAGLFIDRLMEKTL